MIEILILVFALALLRFLWIYIQVKIFMYTFDIKKSAFISTLGVIFFKMSIKDWKESNIIK
jgi:uncharacterized membrane protein